MTASYANADNTLLAVNQFKDGHLAPLKALSAIGHYVKLHFLPLSLFPEYPSNRLWWQILIGFLCLIPLGLFLSKFLRAAQRPPLHLGLFVCFFILLLPTLGFITTPLEFAADRLSYLPSLFFWAALIGLLSQSSSLSSYRKKRPLIIAIAILVLAFFMTFTHRQRNHWKDDSALISHILRHQPEHYLANFHHANKLALAGNFQEALPVAQKITQVHPHRYGGHQTLSNIYLSMENPSASLKGIDAALSQATPIKADLYILRSDSLRVLAKYPEAIESCGFAQQNGMNLLTVHYHKALIYQASGQIEKAQSEIDQALLINPRSAPIRKLQKAINSATE